ncbi:MAG TPA: hypothetical protein VI874_03640 [Candidatus Norongarragalinales archaeon]|nr:hypothetical protein [Candidatus Norongarragalinales archaeon]
MKGFLLTLDTLFALSLLSMTMGFVFLTQDATPPVAAWAVTASDQARVAMDSNTLQRLTGLKTVNQAPGGPIFVHGASYTYPILCQGSRSASDPCFVSNDATAANARTDAWVQTP